VQARRAIRAFRRPGMATLTPSARRFGLALRSVEV
jgi:hypothetical protein